MAETSNPSPPASDPPPEPTPEQQTEKFWATSKPHLTSIMDTWFDEKIKSLRQTSSSRTGRTTLPGILADIMFGADRDKH